MGRKKITVTSMVNNDTHLELVKLLELGPGKAYSQWLREVEEKELNRLRRLEEKTKVSTETNR